MAQLIFYDTGHTYEVDGVKMDSVSEILRFLSKEEYDDINQYHLDNAAERGTAVHKACEALYKYGSVECTPDVEPYVMAFLQFLKDHKCDFTDIERPLADVERLYTRSAPTTTTQASFRPGQALTVTCKPTPTLCAITARRQAVLPTAQAGRQIQALPRCGRQRRI